LAQALNVNPNAETRHIDLVAPDAIAATIAATLKLAGARYRNEGSFEAVPSFRGEWVECIPADQSWPD
jgi:hypothetical protein